MPYALGCKYIIHVKTADVVQRAQHHKALHRRLELAQNVEKDPTPEQLDGQLFALFVIAIAAAEAAVGLALIISVYRSRKTINLDELNLLQG